MIAEDQGFFGAELFVDDARFLVHHTDFITLGYYFRDASNKPFLASVVGPSGRNMVDAQPSDHAHHRGIWWGHGDVNGVDYYLEVPKVGEDHPIGTDRASRLRRRSSTRARSSGSSSSSSGASRRESLPSGSTDRCTST